MTAFSYRAVVFNATVGLTASILSITQHRGPSIRLCYQPGVLWRALLPLGRAMNMGCSECQLEREMHCPISLTEEVAPQCSWQAALRLPFGASQKPALYVHQELLPICFHFPSDRSNILTNRIKSSKLKPSYSRDSLQSAGLGGWRPPNTSLGLRETGICASSSHEPEEHVLSSQQLPAS